MDALLTQATMARQAALTMQAADTDAKNRALTLAGERLVDGMREILEANARDVAKAREKGLKESFIERLTLNETRVQKMCQGLREVVALRDPVGETLSEDTRPNGLRIRKVRVPLGVIGIIYESRPDVTVDAAALCMKSGNAVILRGGSDALLTNISLMRALQSASREAGLPDGCVSLVEDVSHETAARLMRLNGLVDVLIPRGGKRLIHSVMEQASVPVIQTGDGVCHVYVDGACDMDMALNIAVSAKVSRPSVCNSAETLLVDKQIAAAFLPECVKRLREAGVEVRGCERTRAICPDVIAATDEDWDTEYNALIYSVKVADGLDAAIDHINSHGTCHSEAIVTNDAARASRFQSMVDAACVYVNASTRFTDGGEFGLGAEIGISNQKLHARGPMGLNELTTYKYLIDGDGQIR